MQTTVQLDHIHQLVERRHENPFEILGPHEVSDAGKSALAIRGYFPWSTRAWIVDSENNESPVPMRRIHPAGLYEGLCDVNGGCRPGRYQFRVADESGNEIAMHDPYAFPPYLTEYDLFLLSQGNHWKSYEKLGAHVRRIDGVEGVNFAVWAPNASSVSVIGEFNYWDGRLHQMRKHIPSGFWELFIPGISNGATYKYEVNHHGRVMEKSDPYAMAAEVPPRTASIVSSIDGYSWKDSRWLGERANRNSLDAPMSVLEVHLGSWKRPGSNPDGWLNYRDLAHDLVDYCTEMGYTHIELLPISEHPFSASWGYQPTGYYAPTSRFGSPDDFMYFVDHCHQHDLAVILDWVPAHFPRDGHGLAEFDGTCLYEHADPRQGAHSDWGTLIFNYGRNEVRNFLTANALFWLDKYHIDGLRVDAVASMLYLDYSREEGEWLPNEFGGRENLAAIGFIKQFNEQVHLQYPGVLTIAEESTAFQGVSRPTYLGGLGFSLKWNMGWMNDTLEYIRHDPIHRQYHHDELTFSLIYAFHENFVLPFSHDEVVHGKGSMLDKMPGDLWQRFANLRLLYAYMWGHPGKKLLFMGGDIGQWTEWDHDSSVQWDLLQWESHQGLKKFVADLNRLYRREPALHEVDFDAAGFEWIDCHTYQSSTLSFLRRAKNPKDFVEVSCNFTPMVREGYRLGVPELCWYEEILNSDSEYYSGSNVGNYPGVMAEEIPAHGRPYSIQLTLPPLATIYLKPKRGDA